MTNNKKLNILLQNVGDMALKRRARRIIEEINPQKGDRILEVGCGDGFYLHLITNLGVKEIKLTGIDIDQNALNAAKRNLRGKGVKLIKANLMEKLPFEGNSFNKIIMSEVCEHLPDDIKGLKEVKRVLNKGGILVATVPNHNYPFFWDPVNWILEHFFNTHIKKGFWAGIWNQHIRLYSQDEIKKVAVKAGFKVKKIEAITYWCLPFNHNLINLIARKLYSGNISPKLKVSMSKYQKNPRRPFLINFAFFLVNSIDRLNDYLSPKNSGVGILIKASK